MEASWPIAGLKAVIRTKDRFRRVGSMALASKPNISGLGGFFGEFGHQGLRESVASFGICAIHEPGR